MRKRRRLFEPKISRTPPNLQKLVRLIFSGSYLPGDRLVERDLSKKLDLSRIPVREGLQKLVSKGILLKDKVNHGLRLRDYVESEVTHLREYREAVELTAARAACHNRTPQQLEELRRICDEMEAEVPDAPSVRWMELDWQFHQTMVEASRNERFINDFDLLMLECNFVFYQLPDTMIPGTSRENPLLETHMISIVEVHRKIVKLLELRDTNGIVDAMWLHLAGLSNRVDRDLVKSQFAKKKPNSVASGKRKTR